MGRVKSTLIKRTAEQLLEGMQDSFTADFEKNKKVLNNVMPRRIRNMVAGYITRLKKSYSQKSKSGVSEASKTFEQK
jgi:small subunit ribosomal protein S17e